MKIEFKKFNLHCLYNSYLFKNQFSELFRAVKARLGPFNGVPRQEMRGWQLVATFVEIGSHLLATKVLYATSEKCCSRNNLNNAPAMLSLAE